MAFVVFLLSLFGYASAADATGILKVSASVKGAQIYLDGAEVGTTPLLRYVPAGPHALRIVADNFDPFVRAITIEADKTVEVNAQLQAGPGSVEFSGPAGTSVSFNGKQLTLPVRVASPGTGTFPWSATAPGFETSTGTVEAVGGRNYLVDIKLESSAGVFGITSTPAGAAVTLDGVDVGVTPVTRRGVPEGKHGVRLTLDGYATEFASVDTTGGRRGTVDAALGTEGAIVTIDTGSADAQVRINDAPAGTGSKVTIDRVAPGRVTVAVTHGANTSTGSFRVPNKGKLDLQVAGTAVIEKKALTQRWGFWAAVGGGAVAAGAGVAVAAVLTAPEPPPSGDDVVRLP